MEQNCPKEMAWKVNLYRGYLAICNPDDHHLNVVIIDPAFHYIVIGLKDLLTSSCTRLELLRVCVN